MATGFMFMDLPAELRIACLEFCFENWTILLRLSTPMESLDALMRYQLVVVDRRNNLACTQTCRALRDEGFAALLKKYDRKATVPSWVSTKNFLQLLEKHHLGWVAKHIERFDVYVPPDLNNLSFLPGLEALQEVHLHCNPNALPFEIPRPSVLDVLDNDVLDGKVLLAAKRLHAKIVNSGTDFGNVLKEGKNNVKVTATWTDLAYHGSLRNIRNYDDCIYFTVLLSETPIRIIEKKAQLENQRDVTIKDDEGNLLLNEHYLRLVWPDCRAPGDEDVSIGGVRSGHEWFP